MLNNNEGRVADAILKAYMGEVRRKIITQLEEQILPEVNLSIQQAADEAMASLRPAIEQHYGRELPGVATRILLRVVDDREPKQEGRG